MMNFKNEMELVRELIIKNTEIINNLKQILKDEQIN
tara:strand:+ start:3393 stop:3500 length:108 start_codon:yes stop_codon:yes gene_type:complete